MLRRAVLAAALVIGGLGTGVGSISPADASASDEQAFVARINSLRASKGLGSLAVHGELTAIGRNWAGQMAAAGRISHNPNFASQVTANWAKLGENVGVGGSVDSLMQAFINSPGHYANLVDPAFTHIGVGVTFGGGRMFTSHQFMKLQGATAPAPAPAPKAPAPAPKATAPAPAPKATPPRPVAPATTSPRASAPAASRSTPTTAAPAPVPEPEPPVVPLRVRAALERLADLDATA